MPLIAGTLLSASVLLENSFFEKATILITEHNATGAVGFVINKLFERKLNELEEFRHSCSFPIYDGGPVGREHLYFIHCRPDIISESKKVSKDFFFSGNFSEVIKAINNKTFSEKDVKIFIGYCGWDAGELEAEIEEGSWIISTTTSIF